MSKNKTLKSKLRREAKASERKIYALEHQVKNLSNQLRDAVANAYAANQALSVVGVIALEGKDEVKISMDEMTRKVESEVVLGFDEESKEFVLKLRQKS